MQNNIKSIIINLKEEFGQFYLKKVKRSILTDEKDVEINDIIEKQSSKLDEMNQVFFDNFGVTTTLTGKCCMDKTSSCFKINDDCINNLMDTDRYKPLKYDENSLRFVMALQTFEGGKQEAYHVLNFLGIPTSWSFIHKKYMTLKYI